MKTFYRQKVCIFLQNWICQYVKKSITEAWPLLMLWYETTINLFVLKFISKLTISMAP